MKILNKENLVWQNKEIHFTKNFLIENKYEEIYIIDTENDLLSFELE